MRRLLSESMSNSPPAIHSATEPWQAGLAAGIQLKSPVESTADDEKMKEVTNMMKIIRLKEGEYAIVNNNVLVLLLLLYFLYLVYRVFFL